VGYGEVVGVVVLVEKPVRRAAGMREQCVQHLMPGVSRHATNHCRSG
jgi:hypothetical protein